MARAEKNNHPQVKQLSFPLTTCIFVVEVKVLDAMDKEYKAQRQRLRTKTPSRTNNFKTHWTPKRK